MSGGGGSGGGNTTVTNTNVPEYFQPQMESMLGAAMNSIFNYPHDASGNITGSATGFNPYVPYSGNPEDYTAGFSPMQEQAFGQAANMQMPGQWGQASQFANQSGYGMMDAAQRGMDMSNQMMQRGNDAINYGTSRGDQYGGMGAGYGARAADYGMEGGDYYGGMGAGYGARGAQYGDMGAGIGQAGMDYGVQRGNYNADLANSYGYGAMEMGRDQGLGAYNKAFGYGQAGSDIGMGGLGYGAGAAGYGAEGVNQAQQGFGAGKAYGDMATDPNQISKYMSPYMENVVQQQQDEAIRNSDIQRTSDNAKAVHAGAFGGSRQAIMDAEGNRNLQTQLANIDATGRQKAFEDAKQSQQFQSNLGLQGLQAGYQGLDRGIQGNLAGMQGIDRALAGQGMGLQGVSTGLGGLNSAMQGYGMGLQGVGAANQAAGLGMQGYGMGMQGADSGMRGAASGMQGAGMGMQGKQLGLSGLQGGMQGASIGLQGGQLGNQAYGTGFQGYGMGNSFLNSGMQGWNGVNQAAGTLGSLGGQQLQGQQSIIDMQKRYGDQQQQQQQNYINNAINNFGQAQQWDMNRLGQMSALLHGLPMNQVQQQYVNNNPLANMAGLGSLGYGMYGMMGKAAGGAIKEDEGSGYGLDSLALYNAVNR